MPGAPGFPVKPMRSRVVNPRPSFALKAGLTQVTNSKKRGRPAGVNITSVLPLSGFTLFTFIHLITTIIIHLDSPYSPWGHLTTLIHLSVSLFTRQVEPQRRNDLGLSQSSGLGKESQGVVKKTYICIYIYVYGQVPPMNYLLFFLHKRLQTHCVFP